MACPSEFTCAVYADGELPANEALGVRTHLRTCTRCRETVEALRVESRVLIQSLQQVAMPERELTLPTIGIPGQQSISLTMLALIVAGAAAMLRLAFGVLENFELPASLEWLNPLSRPAQLNLAINAVTYLISEGGSMMESILDGASFLAVCLLVLFGTTMLFRQSRGIGALLSVIAFLMAFSSPGYAIEVRRGIELVTVPSGETIDDTLVVFGDSVSVDGIINGDLITFARLVTVRGTVKGNLISFGQRNDMEGTVEGSIFSFGQFVQTRGQVARNLYGFGQEVGIGSGGNIGGNATMFGAVAIVDGKIGRDLSAFSGRVDVRGDVARNVDARTGAITVQAPAHIGGNLSANVRRAENVRVDSGAKIDGKTDVQIEMPRRSRYATLSFYIWRVIWIIAAFITGMIAFWIAPPLASVSLDTGRRLLQAAGVGFIAMVATPIAAIICMITLIGLPIGIVTLVSWLVAGYLAKIVIAMFLGRALLAGHGERPPAQALMLLAGLVLTYIAINLPYIGGLIEFLLFLLGLGALVMVLYENSPWRRPASA